MKIIEGYLSPETVRKINDEWPTDWHVKEGRYSHKWDTATLPETAREVVASVDIGMVERVTGIQGLFLDQNLFGAGLHCIPRGGFLKMHVDFNRHPKGWWRRVNMLVYLNERWEDDWGGDLQMGLEHPIKIAPIGGRCVIFETNETSWHGHPEPLNCPEDVQRRSLALYFYTQGRPDAMPHTTIYADQLSEPSA